ncbi:hypothetical protein M8J77_016819 [Diaphorina citri]|nr:hypothetical protein M8J77_016819 [Diaphorina citri]
MSSAIRDRCKRLVLSDHLLQEVMSRLNADIDKGLHKDTHATATVKCFPTFIQDLPQGTETGKFLALDLGGTNFRVLMIYAGEKFRMEHKTYPISPEIMTGPGEQLFDYIAESLENFVREQKAENEHLPLGFTFSFPVDMMSLTKGVLVRWTKGFKCEGVVGANVVELLQQALVRRSNFPVNVVAILNDTAGCLVSCAYDHKHCKIGVIVGTGFNACYVERTENVSTFENEANKPFVVINTEWGAFGDDGALDFLLTEFDRTIDDRSLNRGQQIYEKMVSGMYMGEIVRLMMEKFTEEGILFNGKGSHQLSTRGIFDTMYISTIEAADVGDISICRNVLYQRLALPHATAQDCIDVRYLCRVVSQRSAHLASAGIATLLNRMDFSIVTVGVDGSVYRYHPYFHHMMLEKIPALISHSKKVNLVLSEDGSGRGAAFVAAVAADELKRKEEKRKQQEEKRKQQEELERQREEKEMAEKAMRQEQTDVISQESQDDSNFSVHIF